MDEFHERVARVALASAERFGFCLAGGYAVQAHGFVERLSEDVDLFTTMAVVDEFPTAVEVTTTGLRADGLDVTIARQGPTFARLAVLDPATGKAVRVELGVDWRANSPTKDAIGPVLHPDDAVANKVCALYGRGEVRDYVDFDGIVCSGSYTLQDLLILASDHDPGFDNTFFAEALEAVQRFPDSSFDPYGLSAADTAALRARVLGWAGEIRGIARRT